MRPAAFARPLGLLLDLALPPRCAVCRTIVAADDTLCAGCWPSLTFITAPRCAACGAPFAHDIGAAARCGACLAKPPRFTAARAPFAYDGAARAIALGFKLGDRPHLARLMAAHMARDGADWLGPGALLTPVPLHRWRLLTRGFNQAALLARAIGRASATPIAIDALVRGRRTAHSPGLNRRQRAANVRAAFRVPKPAQVAGRDVVLVDDVFTTGATAAACADALQRVGARTVRVLTFARVVRDGGH